MERIFWVALGYVLHMLYAAYGRPWLLRRKLRTLLAEGDAMTDDALLGRILRALPYRPTYDCVGCSLKEEWPTDPRIKGLTVYGHSAMDPGLLQLQLCIISDEKAHMVYEGLGVRGAIVDHCDSIAFPRKKRKLQKV